MSIGVYAGPPFGAQRGPFCGCMHGLAPASPELSIALRGAAEHEGSALKDRARQVHRADLPAGPAREAAEATRSGPRRRAGARQRAGIAWRPEVSEGKTKPNPTFRGS